ncbi:MAG: glycine cleavage system aminomethyltransferase GcvT [Halobacteriales archaeon]
MDARRTALYDDHEAAGARFTTFGGWEMPVAFEGIAAEHAAVRGTAGRFDVSHMGEIDVRGPDATTLMQRLTTNDVTALEPWTAQYAAITDEDGVMLDDTLVFRYGDDANGRTYRFVPNAGHNESMAARWVAHRQRWELDATVADRTDELAMLAVQGPEAVDLVDDEAQGDLASLRRFGAARTTVGGVDAVVSRTGYTGEDGVEIVCDWDDAATVWSALACQRCGLGARDTLRLEAGLLLGGNEFDHEDNPRTPLEAGIGFAVALDTDFVGRDALRRQAEAGPEEVLAGIGLTERGIPRTGYSIRAPGGDRIGTITSGTQSPTLDRPIALGYVDADRAEVGTAVEVEIRGEARRGTIESLPFVG